MTETQILMAKVHLIPNTTFQLVISRNHAQTKLGLLLEDETPGTTMELCNRQHCVKVMLSLLGQADRRAQYDEEVTKTQPYDFLWLVNVYAGNMLTDKTLSALHANCEVMY